MRRTFAVALCLVFALAGCKAKELAEKAAISKDLEKRGTMDLAKEISKDEYTAPADGRLTDKQIQMYLKVREHEKKIAEVAKEELKKHAEAADKGKDKSIAGFMEGMKALGSAADVFTADLRAAKDLGYNSQEYVWVKGQIMAASVAAMGEQFNQVMTANVDKAYQEAKKAYDEAKDEQTKKMYGEMLAGYDKSKQEMKQNATEDPAVTYNRQLLAKYENQLNAFAHELSKWEDKPGAAQKAVDEVAKQAEAAKKQ